MVRRFALALRAEDPRHEVPPDNVFGHPERRRRKPYIYTPNEIAQLLTAATKLGPAASIKASIYETLFGLLAATGMRISEALALRLGDVTADGLLIRTTKFQKSRLLPLHSTTQAAIDKYLEIRAGVAVANDYLFLSASLGPLPYDTATAVCPSDRRAIARHLVALSTYLGHARVIDTYWYLEATPILLKDVAAAGEMLLGGTQA
jgi:integrase